MILDSSEILAVLGIADTVDTATLGTIVYLHPLVERAVKQHVHCNLESAEYTHYLPIRESVPPRDALLDAPWNVQGNQAVQTYGRFVTGDRLTLPEIPVRSVSRVCIDVMSWGGQAANAFPASGDLTAGVHYYLDVRTPGISTSGQIVRIAGAWPQVPSSVLVTYTAGYTRAELDGDSSASLSAAELKQAVMLTFLSSYSTLLAARNGGAGAISRERIGNYSVEYNQSAPATDGFHVTVPPAARDVLSPYINYGRLLGS